MPASGISDGGTEAASGPGGPAGPGGRLRRAREAQGLQLEEVANELRVSAAALAALEENRFEALGAAVFARGYLKQYGTRLGLEPRELLALYDRTVYESEIALAPTKGIRLRDERQISRWVVAMIALGGVIGGLSYWWWSQSNVGPGPAVANVDGDTRAPVAAASSVAAPDSGAGAANESADEPVEERAAEVAAGANSGADAEGGESPGAALAAASTVAASDSAPAETAARESPIDPGPAAAATEPLLAIEGRVLEVTFIEDSWAEVTAGDGSRLYYNLGRAGTRARFPADRDLNLYFGRAAGIELRVEGEVVPVPRASPNGIVRFDLDDVID